MWLCSSCWEEKCKCGENHYVQIDDEMVEIIVELNFKGYMTRNCCAGHMEHRCGRADVMCTYVQFFEKYDFATIPEMFRLEEQETEDGPVHNIIRSVSCK